MKELPATFRLKDQILKQGLGLAGILLSVLVPLFFFIAPPHETNVSVIGIFIIVTFLLCLMFCLSSFVQSSPIIVDGDSISRSLFGWRWNIVRWEDIKTIRIVSSYDLWYNKNTRMISLMIPYKRRPGFRFNDAIDDTGELIAFMNQQAEKYHIPILAGAKELPAVFNPGLYGRMVFTAILLVAPLFIYLGMIVFHQNGIFATIFIAAALLLLVVSRNAGSQTVVDDDCISKRLFGWTWNRIRWKDVREIFVFRSYDRNLGKSTRMIRLRKTSTRFSGLMFSDTVDDADTLIAFINHQAEKYNIIIKEGKQTIPHL